MKSVLHVLISVMILSLAGRVYADTLQTAQAYYGRGAREERAGQYQEAIADYRAALGAAPGYAWAYRELGNCYYYLGQKAWAVECYDRYLTAHPEDARIKSFADSLRGGGTIPASRWDAKAMLGYQAYSKVGLNLGATSGGSSASVPLDSVSGGMTFGAEGEYWLNQQWSVGGELDYFLASGSFSQNESGDGENVDQTLTLNVPALWIAAVGAYHFNPVLQHLKIDLSGGIGLLTLQGANFNVNQTITGSESLSQDVSFPISGDGAGFQFGADATWDFGWGPFVFGGVYYRYADISNATILSDSSDGSSADIDANLNYSGLGIKIGGGFNFY